MQEKKISDRIGLLARKWQDGQLTEAEKTEFDAWYASFDDSLLQQDSQESVDELRQRLYSAILEKAGAPVLRSQRRLWIRYAAAASVILLLSGAVYYILEKHPSQPQTAQQQSHDIAPGGNRAILTLANGTEIILDSAKKGQLAQQQNTTIEKTADGAIHYNVTNTGTANNPRNNTNQTGTTASAEIVYNTISTPRGGQYTVALADGTKITLNAASSLHYPTAFNGKNRSVELRGEAWFEVAADKQHPFIVTTGDQEVKVLGTQFNLNAYNDEPAIKTTLLAGSVIVSDRSSHRSHSLSPGQQSILTSQDLVVTEADTEEATAWKNGYFMFQSEEISSIMRKLARWYDVDISFNGTQPADKFNGTIQRFVNVSQVLRKLELTNKVHFTIEGRKIIVSK